MATSCISIVTICFSQTDLRAIYFSSSLIAECTSFTKSQQVHADHGYVVSQKNLSQGLFGEDYARPIQPGR